MKKYDWDKSLVATNGDRNYLSFCNTHKIKTFYSFIPGNREVTAVMVKQNWHCNEIVIKKVVKKTYTPFASSRKAW